MSIRVCEFFVLPTVCHPEERRITLAYRQRLGICFAEFLVRSFVRQDDKIVLIFLTQSALRFTQRGQSYFNVEFSQNLKIKFAKLCVDNALRIFLFYLQFVILRNEGSHSHIDTDWKYAL